MVVGFLKDCLTHVPRKHNELYEKEPGYTFENWKTYRSFVMRMRPEPMVWYRVILGIWLPLLLVVVFSALVCCYFYFLVPLGAPPGKTLVSLLPVFTFFVTLLMVFKLNSSYARWWEGRTLWGSMLGALRTYLVLAMCRLGPDSRHVADSMRRWVPASALLLKEHLRSDGDWLAAVTGLLQPQELQFLQAMPNRPLAAAHVLSMLAVQATPDSYIQAQIQAQVTLYLLYSAGCERILKTPIPTGYSRFTSRAVIAFVFVVPILIWNTVGWGTPVLALLIAFIVLGTENVSVQIEEPFRVLHLEGLCDAVEAAARDVCPWDGLAVLQMLKGDVKLQPPGAIVLERHKQEQQHLHQPQEQHHQHQPQQNSGANPSCVSSIDLTPSTASTYGFSSQIHYAQSSPEPWRSL